MMYDMLCFKIGFSPIKFLKLFKIICMEFLIFSLFRDSWDFYPLPSMELSKNFTKFIYNI